MPLQLEIPARELFDEAESRFLYTPRTILTLEHSLLSVSHWESKWKKPYLRQKVLTAEANAKTPAEEMDYIRCMTIGSKEVDPNVYRVLNNNERQKIADYINDPMTATTVAHPVGKPPSREIVTSELIYYWMAALQIPFRPCETWHLNRLLKLIEVGAAKNEQPKKMNPADHMARTRSINHARRAAHRRR